MVKAITGTTSAPFRWLGVVRSIVSVPNLEGIRRYHLFKRATGISMKQIKCLFYITQLEIVAIFDPAIRIKYGILTGNSREAVNYLELHGLQVLWECHPAFLLTQDNRPTNKRS